MEVSRRIEREIQHLSHEHPLVLKAEKHKTDDAIDQPDIQMACCRAPNSGPFYSCQECKFFLHKVCAELPNEMNHPMHPQHALTLLIGRIFRCNMCRRFDDSFVFNCSICDFDVDTICASASVTLEDKCHQHPLTPMQLPIPFLCHICHVEEKGLSYKCTVCPFWVHQNCTVLLTDTVKHSYHKHPLTLLQSVPFEYDEAGEACDICHDLLYAFHCVYSCYRCMFFTHVSCARPEIQTTASLSMLRIDKDLPTDDQCIDILPMQPNSTDLISWFIGHNVDLDANIPDKIDHFSHNHPLFYIDEQVNEEICLACAVPIRTPSYGCRECAFFIHKCCTELPKQFLHPSHPEHELSLCGAEMVFNCRCCWQFFNGFRYDCLKCGNYKIDIKCASLIRPIYHKAHKHTLIPKLTSSMEKCNACGSSFCIYFLCCNTCSFKVCFKCAMSPPTIKHRWDKHPFILTYSPSENHYNEYYCILCEKSLNPKQWFYYCSACDQFAHVWCMVKESGDSNIIYGESYKFRGHEHNVTLIDCTYNTSICDVCRHPLKRDFSVGFECKSCDFNVHLKCMMDKTSMYYYLNTREMCM